MVIRNISEFQACRISLHDGRELYRFFLGETGGKDKRKTVFILQHSYQLESSSNCIQSQWTYQTFEAAKTALFNKFRSIIRDYFSPGECRKIWRFLYE